MAPPNQIYNIDTEQWKLGAPIPTGVFGASGGFIGGKVYVAGGCVSSDCRIGVTNAVQVYDTAANNWSTVASMQTPREGFGTGVIGGKLFAVGGTSACPPCTPLSAFEVYTPATNLWTALPSMPTARAYFGTAVIGKNCMSSVGRTEARPTMF